ncbi:hypothetical protein NEILACOT_04011 [Neisseria lactamica ATCC 23970]|uniref:Uncharacterized protein n=4 Tax=Neisseria TaxID=482 RepID=D0W906_NEILA|nr:hypothetical protein NEILACOT_04011 [Neisseria lactamica ATCC 23970]
MFQMPSEVLRRHFCQKGKRQYPLYTRKQSKDVKTVCISWFAY